MCVRCVSLTENCVFSRCLSMLAVAVFFFKQKTAYEMRISDWSSDVCSSDLLARRRARRQPERRGHDHRQRDARDGARRRMALMAQIRSEERRVGKECVSKV